MKMIAAVDRNWAIGYQNRLLVSIPEDMKFFRRMTTGKVVLMGRRTLESFPGQRPLPKRENLVLTRNPSFQAPGAVILHSEQELFDALSRYDTDDVFVIGGESVYRRFAPYCDTAYITWIDFSYQADAHFPNLDETDGWTCTEESEEQTYFDLAYTFRTYRNEKVLNM